MSSFELTTTKAVYRMASQFADIEDSHVAPEVGYPILEVSGYAGPLSITDNDAGGAFELVPTFTDKWIYIPKNETKGVVITADDGESTDSKPISIEATFPIQPHFGFKYDPKTLSKSLFAKDNTPHFRRVRKRSISWDLNFFERTIMDVSVVQSFWDYHDIDLEFWLIDIELSIAVKVRFDSEPETTVRESNRFEMACLLKAHSTLPVVIPVEYSGV